jgi:polyphosphate kinase 2 (PPK2 family)
MVERVEGFATNQEWSRAYQEINDFEESQTNFGAIVIKLFLYISKEEQLVRFEDRQSDPNKVWKITDEDWRNREKWDIYVEAVNDMIEKTDKKNAPWIVINGNDKRYARVKALETIVEICEKKLYDKNGK